MSKIGHSYINLEERFESLTLLDFQGISNKQNIILQNAHHRLTQYDQALSVLSKTLQECRIHKYGIDKGLKRFSLQKFMLFLKSNTG